MLIKIQESLASTVFKATDSKGERRTFTLVDDFEKWAEGRHGISVDITSPHAQNTEQASF